MIQYIVSATAIWLLSLVVFDLCLRKSTHHAYNRAYLVATALLGALLPLYHPGTEVVAALSPALVDPALAVADVKQSIAAASSTAMPSSAGSGASWLRDAYIAGIAISFGVLLREAALLYNWYRRADKVNYQGRRLVLTHREHGPFSALGRIFLTGLAGYTAEELRFILQHEDVHIHRRHYLDKAFMLLLRCIFWIHPLPYIYYRRLMMVHEYEADDRARPTLNAYGHFLLQQQLAGAAPCIAHSFFHSPLKNRIKMLTRTRTRAWRKAAYLLALPAIAAFSILWVNNSTAHKREKKGNLVMFGGNTFELGLPALDGRTLEGKPFLVRGGGDNVQGQIAIDNPGASGRSPAPAGIAVQPFFTMQVRLDSIPVKMNGQKIFEAKDLSNDPQLANGLSPMEQLGRDIQSELSKLPDGEYAFSVRNVIIDEKGRVVYYQVGPVSRSRAAVAFPKSQQEWDALKKEMEQEEASDRIDDALAARISEASERSLDAMSFQPALKDSKPVVARVHLRGERYEIVVKDGVASRKPGC
jgi:hypothetical protein